MRRLACLLALSAACAVPSLAGPPAERLSSSGRLLLRFGRGELDAGSVWTAPALKLSRAAVRPGLRPRDVRINDVQKDLAQMRNSPEFAATTQSETSVAAFGRAIVVGYNDSAALGTTSRSLNGYSVSSDGGVTWTDGNGTPSARQTINLGDPAVAANRQGVFYYASIVLDYSHADSGRGVIGVAKSTDGGRTFGLPVQVNPDTAPLRSPPGPTGEVTEALSDKEWLAVDTSAGVRSGALYTAWNQYAATTFASGLVRTTSQIVLSRSTDGGLTWSAPLPVSPQRTANTSFGRTVGAFVSGAMLAVGPGGEVYCAWEDSDFNSGTNVEAVSRSDDGGQTFSISAVIAANANSIGNPDEGVVSGGPRINEFPGMAVDQRNGAIYIVYASAPTAFPGNPNDPAGADRSNVYLVRSADRAATWSPAIRLNDDRTQADQWFPAVAVNGAGTVGVIWYDRRNDPYNQRFDVYGAVSADGGRTFTGNRRLTAVSSPLVQTNPNFDRGIAPNYMGDYIGLASGGYRFYGAWGDNRDLYNSPNYGPRPDPNIYFSSELGG